MKKRIPKKNSIDGENLPDSRLEELLDRCIISVKDIRSRSKKKEHNGTKVKESARPLSNHWKYPCSTRTALVTVNWSPIFLIRMFRQSEPDFRKKGLTDK